MRDGLATRVSRIISGSLNAILDAVEDTAPEAIMEETIREVDDAIAEVRTELGKVIAAKHLANKKLADRNAKHEDLGDKIELAITQQREDLAQAAVSQQLDIEAQIPVLEQSITEAADKERELEGYIAALQAHKREMHDELQSYRDAKSSATSEINGTNVETPTAISVDKATQAFERVMERHSNTSNLGTTNAKTAAQLQELETLSRQNRVNERLAIIKSRMNGQSA